MYCDLPVFERCCFCFPLRIGILVYGYVSIVINILQIAEYSFVVQHKVSSDLVYYGGELHVPEELSIAVACLTLVMNAVLIYGAHKKLLNYIKVYYYFTAVMVVADTLLGIISVIVIDILQVALLYLLPMVIAELLLQLYILLIIRSLMKRVETSGTQAFDNQLQQVVSGEFTEVITSAGYDS